MADEDRITHKALLRFQIISAYLAADPPRGKRRQMLEHLAAKTWMLDSGEAITVKAETIRYWLRLYRLGGFEALKDKPRSDRGVRRIPEELIETACKLKLEVPERAIERIITIMENMQLAPPGLVRRSTLHRALQARGLSARKLAIPERKDLDRWQADYANDLWQADMLQGPWLPDPQRPEKMRRTYLYAFLDDASRLLLYGRLFFKGDLPALELVFKRALQRYGRPNRVYYDNAMVFRANHMRLICAELSIHRPIYTRPYRPMGHGKIEAFNRYCINNFIAELKASNITRLQQLNEAFLAWVDEEYNQRRHRELGQSPKERWLKDSARIHYLEEEKIRLAFLWQELRTPDKTGVIQLFRRKYKVSPTLAKRRVEVRYDPERLDTIEIYLDGKFRQRAKPLAISPHRAPKELLDIPKAQDTSNTTDYLGWLTKKHKAKTQISPVERKPAKDQTMAEFVAILRGRLDPEVVDQHLAAEFFETFGPFDLNRLKATLDNLLAVNPPNLHLSFYLEHIQRQLIGAQP
jgi:transposase InsO family protein